MTPADTSAGSSLMSPAEFKELEQLFNSAIDSTMSNRDKLLQSLDRSNPEVARKIRSLIQLHENHFPSLDEAPIPQLILPGGKFSPINVTFGNWKITRHIGQGGWADVFEAQQIEPARMCALKVLRLPWLCTSRMLQRFRDEAELLARVEHPGIARVYGAGIANISGELATAPISVPYLALELVPEARSITQYVQLNKLSIHRRLELFCQVCDAVRTAHQCGVLHRDLKPSNILIGSDGQPRVIDFGVACAMDRVGPTVTCTGEFIGTVGYMCPESLGISENGGGPRSSGAIGSGGGESHKEIPPDARWDVYSLGVILYELIVQSTPYQLPANFALAAAIVRETLPTPSRTANPSLPPELCTIIDTAMERDPLRRYQSVADFSADLRRYLSDLPITARPTPLHRRMLLAIRRNPALSAICACSFLGIIAVIATAIHGWNSTRQERLASERVLAVLDDALTTARATRNGDEISVSDLLATAERRLREDSDIPARAAAKIHEVLGRTYENLANYDAAMSHYEAGLKQAHTVWGDDYPLVVQLEIELAGSLYDRGDPAGSARALQSLLSRPLHLQPLELAKTKNDLCVALMRAENWNEAERIGLEAYELRRQQLGLNHALTIQTLINLGANALRLGNLKLAQQRLDEAASQPVFQDPDEGLPRSHAWSFLGLALAMSGERQRSIELCRQAEDEISRSLGRDHPIYAWLSLVWAEADVARGDSELAVSRAADAAKRAARALGENHPYVIRARERANAIAAKAAQAAQR